MPDTAQLESMQARFAPVEAAPPAAMGGLPAIAMPGTAAPTPLWGATPAVLVPPPTPIVVPHTPYLLALSAATPLRAEAALLY